MCSDLQNVYIHLQVISTKALKNENIPKNHLFYNGKNHMHFCRSLTPVQHRYKPSTYPSVLISMHSRRVRLGLAGWLGWPAPSHGHCSNEPASSTSLSHKRTSNDTNQPTEQAASSRTEQRLTHYACGRFRRESHSASESIGMRVVGPEDTRHACRQCCTACKLGYRSTEFYSF